MWSSEPQEHQAHPLDAETSSTPSPHTAPPPSPLAVMSADTSSGAGPGPATSQSRGVAATAPLFSHYTDDAEAHRAAMPPRLAVALPPELGALQAHVDRYNALPPEAGNQQRLRQLNQIDRGVYGWFKDNPAPDLSRAPHAQELRDLLGHTQTEHAGIVDTIRQGALAGTSHELPIDTAGMDAHQQARAAELWRALATQQGRLKVSDEDPAFEQRTYANLAKLMQGDQGRNLLTYLNQGNNPRKDTLIAPGDAPFSQARRQDKADLRPRRPKTGLQRALAQAGSLLPQRRNAPIYQDLSAAADVPGAYMNTVLQPPTTPPVKGWSLPGGAFKKNQGGVGANVTMPRHAEDPRSLDANRNEVITPELITLAHELGHAAKVRGGARAQGLQPSAIEPGAQGAAWAHTAEELINVKGVENPVRAEHNIPLRGNYSATIKDSRRQQLARAFEDAVAQHPELSDADRTTLFQQVTQNANGLKDDAVYQQKQHIMQSVLRRYQASASPAEASSSSAQPLEINPASEPQP